MIFIFSRKLKQAAALSCVVFSIACGSGNQSISTSNQSTSPFDQSTPSANKNNFLNSEKDMQTFTADLKKAVGSEDPNILKLVVYNEYALVQVQDPKKPENIDGYTFRDNKLSPPEPVKLMGGGDLKDNVFPLSQIDLSRLPTLSKEVSDKLKDVEGGKLNAYVFQKNLPFSDDVKAQILTSATRKTVIADADAKGNLMKFEVK